MEHLLLEIPSFRLWRKLTNSIERARSRLAGSMPAVGVETSNNAVPWGDKAALNRSWLGV